MRTLLYRYRIQQLAAMTGALLLAATPALPEAPLATEPTLLQQNHIRRLMLTNTCAACDLEGVTLLEAHLIGADLRKANLRGANLTGSNLEGADLEGADLTGANFTGTFLTDARLVNTQLVGVNFTAAHLYNTDVQGANVANLNLTDAEIFNTPISVGGDALPENELQPLESTPEVPPEQLLEPIIPFEETQPPEPYPEYLLYPVL
ncbi:MAG: pentapeptide repeat-containing protein [Cyanobacteria bacterium J06597_16]